MKRTKTELTDYPNYRTDAGCRAYIAKKIHVARHNDAEGLTKLATWMKELGQANGKMNIVFGIEPTGHYCFPLEALL